MTITNNNTVIRNVIRASVVTGIVIGYWWLTDTDTSTSHITPLVGTHVSPLTFSNPYPHVPAQCYTETASGTQNACLFCHTNGVWQKGMGNNNPQAGAFDDIGNFQLTYQFSPYSASAPLATINRWGNTLFPEQLAANVAQLGIDIQQWNMQSYIRDNNWQAAYDQRPNKNTDWDAGGDSPFRFLPALNPADLPAYSDGYVRTRQAKKGFFKDDQGINTGWRAINFMPYGIFTPQTGSVSGIYIRLPSLFMRNEQGDHDLATYSENLDRLAKAIQDRHTDQDASTYAGQARHIPVERGVYPVGTEFAHPLHYVDVDADGRDANISPFPGTRSQRVKEVRYMIKWEDYHPMSQRPTAGADPESILGSDQQGWVDNGAGWYLVGFIENAQGHLRPQTREELTQCIGCHSGVRETQFPTFTSGVSNTVDSTWAFPRQLPQHGWQEMNYLGYQTQVGATLPEPINRDQNKGEFRLFLDSVVGANLYGVMPQDIESYLTKRITTQQGYPQNWISVNANTPEAYQQRQKQRQSLLRQFTARNDYKNDQHIIHAPLLYPQKSSALAAAAGYRQVVVTQSFTRGKDVFSQTPHTFKAMRLPQQQPTTISGHPYAFGEIITERSVEQGNPASQMHLVGNSMTEIDPNRPFEQGGNYLPNYTPFIRDISTKSSPQ